MTNEVKKCIALIFPEDAQDRTQRILKRLRNDNDKDHHNPGSLTYLGRCAVDHAAADLIESLSKQLDDQTVVIDRIYEQCKTLQNDLKELGFDSIADMYAQLEQTENKLSELLSYATGGRFSNADYSIDDMRRFVDDYNQSECNECDQLEYVNNERDRLNIMLAQAQAMLETRTKERDAAIALHVHKNFM